MASKADALKVLKQDLNRKLRTLDKSFGIKKAAFKDLLDVRKDEITRGLTAAFNTAAKSFNKLCKVGPDWEEHIDFYDGKGETRQHTDTINPQLYACRGEYYNYNGYSYSSNKRGPYNKGRDYIIFDMSKDTDMNALLDKSCQLHIDASELRTNIINKYEEINRDISLYGIEPDLMKAISLFAKMPDTI